MKIIYRSHLKLRLKERKFPNSYPRKIYKESKNHYLDAKTSHKIATAKLLYAGKVRSLVISYDIILETVEIITIHPISDQEIKNKIEAGRWRKDEKS
ncbi:MAG: hypothetical protein HY376_01570 [Candidatus Blackburnbacteria bacterium]|nr:hypothetical protein [Candidatus Blackburnbacteria bacterium]